MRYYKKISTKENILIDDENSKNLVIVNEAEAHAFVYRLGENATKSIRIYDRLVADNPADFSAIEETDWNSIKSELLSHLNSYGPPSKNFYRRPKDGFIYCWDASALKASVFTNPELGTSAILAFDGSYAQEEINLRLTEVSTYETITEEEWLDRKSAILSQLNIL